MLADRLAGRPTRANFRTGELTVCTMVPMRSVPHRVVCLLGLDDDVFPRKGTLDGDDILGRDPCLGERDPRSEDRQLLLDAVMAATERLVLFYTGADPISGQRRPPAIPLSELLDTLTALVGTAGMNRVLHRHPLQPFDPRNFDGPRFGADGPFSFDAAALAGARARQHDPLPRAPLLLRALPAATVEDVALTDLLAFVVNPAQAFGRQRLGLRIPEPEEEIADALDVELDSLASWNLGDRMLTALLSGTSEQDFRALEWRRGTLPPFGFGYAALDVVAPMVNRLVDVCGPLYTGERETVDVAVDLGDNRRLTGTVSDLYRLPEGSATALLRTYYSSLAAAPPHPDLGGAARGRRARTRPRLAGHRDRPRRQIPPEPVDPRRARQTRSHTCVPSSTCASAACANRYRWHREPPTATPPCAATGAPRPWRRLRRKGNGRTGSVMRTDRYVQYVYRGNPHWRNLVEATPAADEAGMVRRPHPLRGVVAAAVGTVAGTRNPGAGPMTMAAFDIRADLPEGTTVLEASAGTGKTYAIVGLATRFLAEGKAKIADLLLVTFSRAATQELRERARDRIVEAEAALADPAVAREDADDLIRHLADVSDAEVATASPTAAGGVVGLRRRA